MNAINFGDETMFVKGLAEVTVTEPSTGNIIGYDKVATEYAITTSMNLGAIEGGMNNALIANIPDTMRLTGTLTSQAFSLEHRAHILGSSVDYGGITPVCETIVADSATLTVSKTPVKSYSQPSSDVYAWCYVRVSGASDWNGTNYGVDVSTGNVQDFTATIGVSYDVQYFVSNASAKVLPIPTAAIPKVVSITLKYGAYSKGVNSDDPSDGTLAGYLFVIVPRAQFTGDAGVSGNQTTNATTDYAWSALTGDNGSAMPNCSTCNASFGNYAYYIFCPCDLTTADVENWGYVGTGKTVSAASLPAEVKLPLVYVMKDGSVTEAPATDFDFITTGGTVNPKTGVVTIPAGTSGTVAITPQSKYTISAIGTDVYTITIS